LDLRKQSNSRGDNEDLGTGLSEGTQRKNNGSSEEEVNDSLLFREGDDDDVNRRYSIGDDRPEDNGEAVISSRR
ncbi:MAG: hypothetical protein IK092_02155, partial [Muribaculaceae bacterium]|nr:hypothetical protein [Muribaculaceae bacterium]